MNLSDINWDLNAAGNWPLPIKAGAIVLVSILAAGAGVYYDTLPELDELTALENKEQELKQSFELKQRKAINLSDYLEQLAEIEANLGEMVKQMPTKAEVASLLIDISQTGLANGLEFRLFQPGEEIHKEFYTELPISIEVVGKYLQLGAFVSGLASLPRVVTVHDVNILPIEEGRLLMKATVKTYNEQIAESAGKAAPKLRKGAK